MRYQNTQKQAVFFTFSLLLHSTLFTTLKALDFLTLSEVSSIVGSLSYGYYNYEDLSNKLVKYQDCMKHFQRENKSEKVSIHDCFEKKYNNFPALKSEITENYLNLLISTVDNELKISELMALKKIVSEFRKSIEKIEIEFNNMIFDFKNLQASIVRNYLIAGGVFLGGLLIEGYKSWKQVGVGASSVLLVGPAYCFAKYKDLFREYQIFGEVFERETVRMREFFKEIKEICSEFEIRYEAGGVKKEVIKKDFEIMKTRLELFE